MKQNKTVIKTRATMYTRRGKRLSVLKKTLQRNPRKVLIKQRLRRSRPLHRKLVLNPLSLFTILCAGVFIIGWTYEALADTYTVTAEVPAAPLTEGATITSPTDGTTVTNPNIQIDGTCPSGAYIKVFTNNTFSGVTFCQNNGMFTLSDDLYAGQNDLITQDYNVTNQAGPITPGVTVTYSAPVTSSSSSSSNSESATTSLSNSSASSSSSVSNAAPTESATLPPLLLTSNYQYQTSLVNNNFTWMVDVEGGVPPYAVMVNWGDGKSSTLIFKTDPEFQISHRYAVRGYYAIKVQVADAHGGVRFINLAARIVTPSTPGTINTTNTNYSLPVITQNSSTLFFSNTKQWLWLAWPSFIVVLVMLMSFWLGERQEFRKLYSRHRTRS